MKDLLETNPPRNLEKIQGLNGKITAFRRFISKSVEKAMPLFQTLKGCVNQCIFRWTKEEEKVLEHLNMGLQNLSTLANPIPAETLSIYQATSQKAISAVLTLERDRKQLPIYFVSRAIQGPKLNYPTLEKLYLSLVHTVRR